MNDRDRRPYLLLAGVVLLYVIMRAALVPMVHDECASVLWYAQPGEWLPYRSHWDANNHFLSSGLGALFMRLFGERVWVFRLGSMLSFIVYAVATWRIGVFVGDRFVRWCLWSALLTCPMALDFFSMFRGYAIELAGWTIALDGLLRYARSPATRHLLQGLVGLLLGGCAVIALVPPWGLVLALMVLLLILNWAAIRPRRRVIQILSLAVLGAVPMAFAARTAMHMQDLGLLYHGSLNGLVHVTVRSLSRYVLGSDHVFIAGVIVGLVILATIVAFMEQRDTLFFRSPLVVLVALLWCDVLARIAMAHLFRVNYPEDRAGIHLLPLTLIVVAFAVDAIAQRRTSSRWIAAVLLIIPLRATIIANVDHCAIWPEQCIPDRFVDRVFKEERTAGRPLVVGAQHQLMLALPYAAGMKNVRIQPPQVEDFPHGLNDLRIVDSRFLAEALEGYRMIDSSRGPGLWLLERREPILLEPLDAIMSTPRSGTDEFFEFGTIDNVLLRQRTLFVQLSTTLTVPHPSPELKVVFELNDTLGGKLVYEHLHLASLGTQWNADTLRVARTFLAAPSLGRAVVYIFNPRREHIVIGRATLTLSAAR